MQATIASLLITHIDDIGSFTSVAWASTDVFKKSSPAVVSSQRMVEEPSALYDTVYVSEIQKREREEKKKKKDERNNKYSSGRRGVVVVVVVW